MPKIDIASVKKYIGSGYPAPFHEKAEGRSKQALGDAGGLRQFGVNLVHLPPGGWSSQRHWHSEEDEFVYMLSGELTLIEHDGEKTLRAGECAAFAHNKADGHHLINRSDTVAVYLEVGMRGETDAVHYPDIDMHCAPGSNDFTHKDGSPYPKR
jgi:uncharacterized cupin superfamily protein